MKITIEIDEEEIKRETEDLIKQRIANKFEQEMYQGGSRKMSYIYHNMIKECIRYVLKENIEDISERATKAAATTIANRAIKKSAKEMMEAIISGSKDED